MARDDNKMDMTPLQDLGRELDPQYDLVNRLKDRRAKLRELRGLEPVGTPEDISGDLGFAATLSNIATGGKSQDLTNLADTLSQQRGQERKEALRERLMRKKDIEGLEGQVAEGEDSLYNREQKQDALQKELERQRIEDERYEEEKEYDRGRQAKQDERAAEKSKLDIAQAKQTLQTQSMKIEAIKKDMNDADKRRDPNSNISKFARRQFSSAFGQEIPEDASYDDLVGLRPEFKAELNAKIDLAKSETKAETERVKALDKLDSEASEKVLKIYDKYRSDPEVKELKSSLRGVERFKALPKTKAGDIGRIFSFMKSFDPASVVRESEYKLGQNIGSFLDGLKAELQSKATGEGAITQEMRDDMEEVMEAIDRVTREKLGKLNKQYAEQYKVMGATEEQYKPFLINVGGANKVKRSQTVEMVDPSGNKTRVRKEDVGKAKKEGYKGVE